MENSCPLPMAIISASSCVLTGNGVKVAATVQNPEKEKLDLTNQTVSTAGSE